MFLMGVTAKSTWVGPYLLPLSLSLPPVECPNPTRQCGVTCSIRKLETRRGRIPAGHISTSRSQKSSAHVLIFSPLGPRKLSDRLSRRRKHL